MLSAQTYKLKLNLCYL